MKSFDLGVYLVTDPRLCGPRGVLATAKAAVAGGATMVQLRDKTASDAELIALGKALKAAINSHAALLIVNDRIEVALAIGADGLHLGQRDADPAAARARLGNQAIIGLSVETPALARAANPRLIDYLGVGPVFATATKADHAKPLGFDGLRAICREAAALPKVAIGGLRAEHAKDVIAAGAQGLAVVSAICAAADPQAATWALRTQVDQIRAISG
ncbi:Thiamine-phosphate synthase [Thiorhodovibrio winogradskyi]|uniref:Thiamine-phosphate synthase n=1 Tax=Thiorhodovibrio winogradskyi TaxID=77007 RepID=A0ABZ0SFW8_9GAMM|nr:thiamine phosphate synthase [Thiorhodovibrio winogradskyi]